jgi:CHAD domain-containing protein
VVVWHLVAKRTTSHAESPTDRSTPLLKERIRTLFRHFPKGLAGEEEPIHQMRVAARRLRTALPLLARKPGGRRVREALAILRDVTRAGGGSRDLDVGLSLLERRLKASGSVTPELAMLRRRLKGARSRTRGRMANELLDLPISRLRRRLTVVVERRGEDLFTVLSRLRDLAQDERGKIQEALDSLGERYEPVALHRVRIRCRRLRYAAEVMDALRGQESGVPALFKQVQERLGRIHDAFVLATWMAHQAHLAEARGVSALATEARSQSDALLEESRVEHRQFLEMGPRELLFKALDTLSRRESSEWAS